VTHEIIRPGTNFDFVGKWRICAAISIGMLVVSAIAVAVWGVRLGIDFAGGTEIQVAFQESVVADEGAVRELVSGMGIQDPSVVRLGEPGSNEFLVRFRRGVESEDLGFMDSFHATLEEGVGALDLSRERVEFVGPRVGAELRRDGLSALAIACVLILIYIASRFSLRFAPGAIVALVHDVLITSGLLVILGVEFDLRILAALLAIVGYSLNDTIIVYDRIRENMELRTKRDLPEVVNRSVNQTLSRTILTSGTTLLAVLALLFLGGDVIRSFSVAMTIGILVGTYSSIYIAAPTLLLLERQFGGAAPAEKKKHPEKKKHRMARA
jgi:preprotein translocase subunit SecF